MSFFNLLITSAMPHLKAKPLAGFLTPRLVTPRVNVARKKTARSRSSVFAMER